MLFFFLTILLTVPLAAFNTLELQNKLKHDAIIIIIFNKKRVLTSELIRRNIDAQGGLSLPVLPEQTLIKVDIYHPALTATKGKILKKGQKPTRSFTLRFENDKDNQILKYGIDETTLKVATEALEAKKQVAQEAKPVIPSQLKERGAPLEARWVEQDYEDYGDAEYYN